MTQAGGRINARLPVPGKRPRAGGAERGRADAPPLSLRGRSAVDFCLFRTVICLLLMMLLFLLLLLLLFFFFLLL